MIIATIVIIMGFFFKHEVLFLVQVLSFFYLKWICEKKKVKENFANGQISGCDLKYRCSSASEADSLLSGFNSSKLVIKSSAFSSILSFENNKIEGM